MNTVLCFVFLAFALVLSHQHVQKRGGILTRPAKPSKPSQAKLTANALANLVKADVPILANALVDLSCTPDMEAKKLELVDETGILYDFQTTTCYVIGNLDLSIAIKSKTKPPIDSTTLDEEFQAVVLNYKKDKNTYMILDPNEVRWFFTTPLSGCDMFVARPKATASILGNKPIVIHSNLDKCVNNVKNLQLKGNSVDKLMNLHHPNYELIARVYCEPLPGETAEANQYLDQYKILHPGIKLISYKVDPPAPNHQFYFVGYYQPEKWTFILKGKNDGKLTSELNVPEA